MNTDPKMQAFLEDLAAVCIKHRMRPSGGPGGREYEELLADDRFAVVTSEGELLFGSEDPSPWWEADGLNTILEFSSAISSEGDTQ